jgi:hypothetical protein
VAQGSSPRQKRKRRQRSRDEPAEARASSGAPAEGGAYSRSRAKDATARAALEPLAPHERPGAVTVGAVVAVLLAAGNLIAYFGGTEIGGKRPAFTGILLYSGLMLLVAWGMWKARYWAVLGMETLLGLILLVFGVLIVQAGNVGTFVICIVVLALAGTLFWKLIKSMARIQMPERPGARRDT